jgi:hypothetical protein
MWRTEYNASSVGDAVLANAHRSRWTRGGSRRMVAGNETRRATGSEAIS